MSATYIPISCSYYDRLEAWAVRREIVDIQYRIGGESEVRRLKGVIVDIFSREKVEYLKLDSGKEVRLDYLVAVNNIPLLEDSTC